MRVSRYNFHFKIYVTDLTHNFYNFNNNSLTKMSCKGNANISKSKHYTSLDKKIFLQVLQDYKHIIEIKKNNSATLKDKDVAWMEVCQKYNESTLISQERTVQQLKKLWSNLKQSQRDALTKERQSCMATGGGPGEIETNVDPDIANIAPNLMKTAPILFTSNMTERQINDKHELVFEVISNDDVELLNFDNEFVNKISKNETDVSQDTSTPVEECTKKPVEECNNLYSSRGNISGVQVTNTLTNGKIQNTRIIKGKRKIEPSDTEEKLRMKRVKCIIDQDQQLAHIKLKHEEKIAAMKEGNLRELHDMQLQHLKKVQSLEIQINNAKLRVIECQLDKKNIDPHA